MKTRISTITALYLATTLLAATPFAQTKDDAEDAGRSAHSYDSDADVADEAPTVAQNLLAIRPPKPSAVSQADQVAFAKRYPHKAPVADISTALKAIARQATQDSSSDQPSVMIPEQSFRGLKIYFKCVEDKSTIKEEGTGLFYKTRVTNQMKDECALRTHERNDQKTVTDAAVSRQPRKQIQHPIADDGKIHVEVNALY